MSDDDFDAEVWELHCQGLGIRRIATRLGVNRNRVQRTIKRLSEALAALTTGPDDDTDLTLDELARMDAGLPEPYPPPPPWTLVATEWGMYGHADQARPVQFETWVDGAGREVNDLDRYRFIEYWRDEADPSDLAAWDARAAEIAALEADMEAQRAAFRRQQTFSQGFAAG